MAQITEDNTFTQIVRFDTEPANQNALIEALIAEAERWISRRPGFVSATFHASRDGKHVLNYAQWKDEAAFKGFTEDPESEQLREVIRKVDSALMPHAFHCRVVKSIEPRL